jgi:hypothetical protein
MARSRALAGWVVEQGGTGLGGGYSHDETHPTLVIICAP